MRTWAVVYLLFAGLLCGICASAVADPCQGLSTTCPAPVADQTHAEYRGLIALSGDPSLLNRTANLGSQPGCGDCVWTLTLACIAGDRSDPGSQQCGQAVDAPMCAKNQLAYTLYLSTATESFVNEGIVCLGGNRTIVPVGEQALADVAQYLDRVHPPDLDVALDPQTSLTGLATQATASPPTSLAPSSFGGRDVTETITIAPTAVHWVWGDGSATDTAYQAGSGESATAQVRTQHTYTFSGRLSLAVTATWGASYTVGYQGQTFGPYAATGTLTRSQQLPVTVATSTPVLVSHP